MSKNVYVASDTRLHSQLQPYSEKQDGNVIESYAFRALTLLHAEDVFPSLSWEFTQLKDQLDGFMSEQFTVESFLIRIGISAPIPYYRYKTYIQVLATNTNNESEVKGIVFTAGKSPHSHAAKKDPRRVDITFCDQEFNGTITVEAKANNKQLVFSAKSKTVNIEEVTQQEILNLFGSSSLEQFLSTITADNFTEHIFGLIVKN